MSVNRVILLGNIGNDPDIRYPEKDQPVAFFSLATNERQGNIELTEWHNLVCYGSNAQAAEKYLRKGTRIYAEGRLRTREYEDKFKILRKRTEIIVSYFEILSR